MSRARAAILFMTVILVCVNMHYFWSFDLVSVDGTPTGKLYCTFVKDSDQQSVFFQGNIWPLLDLFVAEVLPFVIVIVASVTTLATVARGEHRGNAAYRRWSQRYLIDPTAVEQLVVTFTAVGVACLVLTFPKFVFVVVKYVVEKYHLYEDFDLLDEEQVRHCHEHEGRQNLANAVCNNAEYCFLSFKFFVYVALSARFRVEMRQIGRSCCAALLRRKGPNKQRQQLLLPALEASNCCAAGAVGIDPVPPAADNECGSNLQDFKVCSDAVTE